MTIEQEMRAVVAGHNAECGARAEQTMVDGRLYPHEIEAWAEEVERLRAIEREYNALGPVAAQIRANVDQMPAVFAEALRPVAAGRARLRAVEAAAREVLAMWDRILPEGVGIEFYASLPDLRT